ncbi:MAG: Bug family tripartite tricarboxylate transporter substrate binding protein, partial [Gammaproteobacteria bacterium]
VFFDMVATGMPQVNSGKVDALAITSRRPLTSLPDMPTLAGQGYDDFEMTAWFSLVAPQNTPPAVISTLQKALHAALQDQNVRKKMLDMGIEPGDGSAGALKDQIRAELPRIETVVKQANIVVQ